MKLSESLRTMAEWWFCDDADDLFNDTRLAGSHITATYGDSHERPTAWKLDVQKEQDADAASEYDSWLCLLEAELQEDKEYTESLGGIKGNVNDF